MASKWQAQAVRRYPKFLHVGGDGLHECWVVLTKCPHEQTTCWRYCLRPSKDEAELLLARWSIEGCGYQCQGTTGHSIWKMNSQVNIKPNPSNLLRNPKYKR